MLLNRLTAATVSTAGRDRSVAAVREVVVLVALCSLTSLFGCTPSPPATGGGAAAPESSSAASGTVPTFSLAWSEYPSWSVFGVADEKGLIDKEAGQQGSVEKKWGVDIVLKQADYDPCLQMYASGSVDAVCITNMDVLAPAASRNSVAILPTSTSNGADACIVTGINSLQDLAGKATFGLENSVSQYTFERNLELQGKNSSDYPFKNMDPGAAAQAMMNGQADIQSIVVWNPFVLETLRKQPDAKVLFDSTTIPEEIIDMVVVDKASLEKEGGQNFACAIIDAYYQMNQMLQDPKSADGTLVALGAKFSSLGLEDMRQVVQQTRFYQSADDAIGLFERQDFRDEIMPRVVEFCVNHGIVDQQPVVGFDQDDAQLNLTTAYLKQVQAGK